jgi:serine/threonine protein kinase
MGEVYRARDTRLGREVAIKVIPAPLTADSDRLQRFEQEARAAAALNHPNILAVYDVGAHNGAPFIVSELLEGETLRERLNGGPLPVRKAIDLGIQIAQALAAAHEKGIVHRDLKPENIFINKDNRAKILDFGLAKLTQTGSPLMASSNVATTPAGNLTQAGVMLGTIGYMAPEQVRGQSVDHRADIFALGAILYEMLSGARAFRGDTSIDTVSAILKEDPPDLPVAERHIPAALARIVDRCLEKNPAARFASAADVAFALEALSSPSGTVTPSAVVAAVPRRVARPWLPWAVAVISLLAAIATAAVFMRSAPVAQTFRSTLLPPEGVSMRDQSPSRLFALSPDGRRIAFVGFGADRRRMLWVRPLSGLTAQPLAGTDDALAPFWSPDSRSIGFFTGVANGNLKKIDLEGGPPTTLCSFVGSPAGADWNSAGDILFTTTGPGGGAIHKVSASGGAPSVLLKPDLKAGESGYWWPFFLPDGRRFVYLALGPGRSALGIYVASIDSSDRKLVLKGGSNAKYAHGHLIFLRGGTLMAQRFDTDRLELQGDAVPIAEHIQTLTPTGAYSVSQTGLLAYTTGQQFGGSRLVWMDAAGRQLGTIGEQGAYADLRLSPDGKRGVVSLLDPARGTRDIWIVDVARDLLTRFTFDAADETSAVWSPDGQRIVFGSRRSGRMDLYEKPASGAGSDTLLLADNSDKIPLSWSPDGGFLLYVTNPATGSDLWVLPLVGTRKPFPFLHTPFAEVPGTFSPDGRWIAYASSESGRSEVYVVPFPGPGGKWQVSKTGAANMAWRRDGREIFFAGPDGRIMAAAVTAEGDRFDVGAARPLFEVVQGGPRSFFDVTPDTRFLVNVSAERSGTSPITLVVNWHEELGKK